MIDRLLSAVDPSLPSSASSVDALFLPLTSPTDRALYKNLIKGIHLLLGSLKTDRCDKVEELVLPISLSHPQLSDPLPGSEVNACQR